jgi:hypothetical protein
MIRSRQGFPRVCRRHGKDTGSGGMTGLNAGRGILDHQTLVSRESKPCRRQEISLGGRLTPLHILARDRMTGQSHPYGRQAACGQFAIGRGDDCPSRHGQGGNKGGRPWDREDAIHAFDLRGIKPGHFLFSR